MSWWATAAIRTRLTAWYAGVLTVLLLVYAAATFLSVRHEFIEQLDDQLHEDFEAAEARLGRTPDGRLVWSGEPHHAGDEERNRVFEVWSATGEEVYRSPGAATVPPPALASLTTASRYETVSVAGDRWRTLSGPESVGGQLAVIRVSRAEGPLHSELNEILTVMLLALPLVVVLSAGAGYLLARRALEPIAHLASEARRITADRLRDRVSVANPHDEIGRLATVINETFGRLESSFEQLRRFTADASHELRTPLAVVRGIGEAAMAERRSPVEYEEAIGSMLEEVDRLTNLVDTLLRLSRADAGIIRVAREPTDLGHLARAVVTSLSVLAEERQQRVSMVAGEPMLVSADPLVLREAVTNVLDNAIKYGPVGSTVTVRVERTDHHVRLTVADEGPGIAPEHRERIFDRFFRVDPARSREDGGTGLGLAIARWAVEIHGGRISVEPRPGGGSAFVVLLPLADWSGRDETCAALQAMPGAGS